MREPPSMPAVEYFYNEHGHLFMSIDTKPSRPFFVLTPEPPTAERTTEALFPSGCPGCGGAIRPGDVVGLVEGDWLCSSCFQ